jgi:hypothetical protein
MADTVTIGAGPDRVVLRVSQDAYKGDAQYVVRVDGAQIGGVLTAQAPRAEGQHDTVTVQGDWAPGPHTVEIEFLNDLWEPGSGDRNLYVPSASYNGQEIAALGDGWQGGGFAFTDSGASSEPTSLPAFTAIGSGPDNLVLLISQDAFQGDALYTVQVDGAQVGGVLTARARRAEGQHDVVSVRGDWGAGDHTVGVTFLNDAWGGTPGADRNLFLEGARYNEAGVAGASAGLWSSGTAGFAFTEAARPDPGPGYRVVLSDDFSAGYDPSHWGQPFPFPTPSFPSSNGAWNWNPGDVAVRDGEMQVTMTRQADGSWTAGGFSSFKAGISIRYGTVEFDARMEEAKGTMGVVLMWPANDQWPPEIDIVETPGQDVLHTLHWDDGGHQYSPIWHSSYDETQWHHYKMTWLPDLVRVEVDGRTVAEWTGRIPDLPMGFGAMGYVAAEYEAWMGGPPDGSTPGVVTLHLDNVVMSQWDA